MADQVFEQLTNLICSVESALSRLHVQEVVIDSFRQLPVARRTLGILEASPELLTSKDPHMPAAVAKLLRRLSQEGAQHIQPPECASCGQQRALRRLAPAGRICDPCSAAQKKMKGQCHRCKEERLVSKGPAKASYCRRCLNELSTEAPDRIINYVRVHQLIAPPMTRAALDSLPTLRSRLVRLMLEIESQGELWFAEPAYGSRQFCRFYDLLRQAGARLPERQCAGCGTTRTLTERVEGQVSCRRCYRQAHRKSCDGCGEYATMERVL